MRYFLTLVFLCLSITVKSQSIALAKNYFDQGEYAKAESVYNKLFERNKNNFNILNSLVSSLQQQEKFEEATEKLKDFAERQPTYPGINIEIGYNYQLQQDQESAKKFYNKAIVNAGENVNYAYTIGRRFHNHNLLDEAVKTYKAALEEDNNARYRIQLADIYGEQGQLELMFSNFLDLIEENEQYYYVVNRHFSEYITSDADSDANNALRKILIKRLQESPEIFYNKMLSWLYVHEKQFNKAFIQEKAIYKRSENNSLSKLVQLSLAAAENDEFDIAEEILQYTIDKAQTDDQKLRSYAELMTIKVKHSKPESYKKIDGEFKTIFEHYGKEYSTLRIQLIYADFLAFKQQKTEEAKILMNEALEQHYNHFEEARIKMKLADILVAEKRFNKALIYYSQIKGLVKNSDLAREATFKVAKTSYYKGDFDWAQTQLKILKQSTSALIANDALALNLLIDENKSSDSIQTALKLFSRADLLQAQGRNEESLKILNEILDHYKGEKIEDDALLKSAKIYEELGQYESAKKAYQKIIESYSDGVLADDAYFYLAELYRTKLNQPDKAQENYKKIIFDHADSIFYVEARKQFRKLRGDDIN